MTIELTRIEEFAVLTLDRPNALNALSFALIDDISRTLDEVAASDSRALLITGAGAKAFCAGADIKELTGRSMADQKRRGEIGQATFAKIEKLPMPSVAIVNGYAFGGGLEMALACTFRIATPNAKMGLPEIKLGLIPGYGGTQRLPRAVGESRAMEMILTGRMVDANEALRMGLVSRVLPVDELEREAATVAATIASYAHDIVMMARQAVNAAEETTLSAGLRYERQIYHGLYGSAAQREGMAAFREKRSPNF